MATGASSPRPTSFPDPARSAKFPVRLAPNILEERRPDSRYFTAKFNHKPSQVGSQRSTTVTPQLSNRGDSRYSASIEDGSGKDSSSVTYAGHRTSDADNDTASYVLVFDRDQQSYTLQPLDEEYAFNLVSTPWESNREKLQQDYKQIPREEFGDDAGATPRHASSGTDDEEDLFGEHGEEADQNKPFDFRHFLDAPPSPVSAPTKPASTNNTPLRLASSPARPGTSNSTITGSALNKASPLVRAKASPLMKPKKHNRTISTSSLGPGRATQSENKKQQQKHKQDDESDGDAIGTDTEQKKKAPPVPKVQLQRKASIRPNEKANEKKPHSDRDDNEDNDNDDFDDDILIIEGEDDDPNEHSHTPAFRGTPSGGAPVSLSQLATSNSPAGFDRYGTADDEDDEDEDDDESTRADADEDVQSMTLGTPAHPARHDSPRYDNNHLSAPTPNQQQDDDADLMAIEAELMSGLESDEDELAERAIPDQQRALPPSSLRQVQAEESESEEE